MPLGNTLFITKRQKGCQAIVTLQNGIVTKVTLKTKGLISGPMACQRIFPVAEQTTVEFLSDSTANGRKTPT